MYSSQLGGGTGYSLRKKINTTPKAHQTLINSASKRAGRSPSPDPDDLPKLPLSQPDFGIPQRPPDEVEDMFTSRPTSRSHFPHAPSTALRTQCGDTYTGFDIDDLLGPGASEADMQSFCVDAHITLSPDMPARPLSEAPQSHNPQIHARRTPANIFPNIFPPTAPLTVEQQARTDRVLEAFFADNEFASSNEFGMMTQPQASGSGGVQVQPDGALDLFSDNGFSAPNDFGVASGSDYNAPADDEDTSNPDFDDRHLQGEPPEEEGSPSSTSKPRQSAGRISKENWERLRSGFVRIDALVDQLALETGRTRDNVISLWQNTHSFKRALMSAWNMYQRYFKDNRAQERKRAGNPTASCVECYAVFKDKQPNWLEILKTHSDLTNSKKSLTTIQTRNRRFNTYTSAICALALNASNLSGFETMIVTVGNCVHEDTGLCKVYASPGAETFLADRLRIDDDSFSGLFRNHVCNVIADQLSESIIATLKEFPDVSLLPKKFGPKRLSNQQYKDDDSPLTPLPEDKSSDYEYVEEDDGEGQVLSAATSATFTELKDIIKNGLGRILAGNFSWSSIPKKLLKNGIQITGWPSGVLFPTQRLQSTSRSASQGIKDIGTLQTRILAEAFASADCQIVAIKADKDDMEAGKIPIIICEPAAYNAKVGARRFFAGGKWDTKGPRAPKPLSPSASPEFIVLSGDSAPTRGLRSRANTATIPDPATDSDDQTLKAQKAMAKQRMNQAAKAAAPEAEIISSDSDGGSAKTKASKTTKATKTKKAKATTKGKAAVNTRTKAPAKTPQPDAGNSSGEDNNKTLKASKSAPLGKGKKAVDLTPVPEDAPVTRKNVLDKHIQPPPPSNAPAKIYPRPLKKDHINSVVPIPPQTDVTAPKPPVLDGADRMPRHGMPAPVAVELTRQSQHFDERASSLNRQEGDQVEPPTRQHSHAPSNPSHAPPPHPANMASRPPVPVSSRPPVPNMSTRPPLPVSSRPAAPVSSRPPVPNMSTRPPMPPPSSRSPPHAASRPNLTHAPKRSAEGDVDMSPPKRLRNNSGFASARDSPPAEERYNGPPSRCPPHQYEGDYHTDPRRPTYDMQDRREEYGPVAHARRHPSHYEFDNEGLDPAPPQRYPSHHRDYGHEHEHAQREGSAPPQGYYNDQARSRAHGGQRGEGVPPQGYYQDHGRNGAQSQREESLPPPQGYYQDQSVRRTHSQRDENMPPQGHYEDQSVARAHSQRDDPYPPPPRKYHPSRSTRDNNDPYTANSYPGAE